MTKETIR